MARDRHVASRLGGRNRAARRQQVRRLVEGDREDLPVAAVVAGSSRAYSGDAQLSAHTVGDLVERIPAAPGRNLGRWHHRSDDLAVEKQLAKAGFSAESDLRQAGDQKAGHNNRDGGDTSSALRESGYSVHRITSARFR